MRRLMDKKFTHAQEEHVKLHYPTGDTFEIAKRLGLTVKQVRTIAQIAGVKKSPKRSAHEPMPPFRLELHLLGKVFVQQLDEEQVVGGLEWVKRDMERQYVGSYTGDYFFNLVIPSKANR
jgi:hypothetical protein